MDNLSFAAAVVRGVVGLKFCPEFDFVGKACVLGYAIGVTLGLLGI